MKEIPRISESEWEVMEVLWDRSPLSAAETIKPLAKSKGWKDNTVKTLLARLVKKNAISYQTEGNRYYYRPLVSRNDLVQAESESFLNRVFGGATSPLLAHFASKAKLSLEEVTELQAMLDQAKEQK